MKLFLSYAHADKAIVDELVKVLRDGGQELWIDEAIRTGEKWQDALRNAMRDADGIVIAITPKWLASAWCQWEFITATELKKKIIPVLLEKAEIPERISQYQFADFQTGFQDEQKIRKFLDDLVSLAQTASADEALSSRKAQLEHAIQQELKLGKVSDSTVVLNQKAAPSEQHSQQKLGLGDISGSTVTINQETTFHSAEKPRDWTIPVILGLVLALLSTVAGVLAVLPETQRNNILYTVGMVAASETPTATASPTLIPSPTPTPSPERLPANGFNVVVAGFAYENANGQLEQSNLADDMSDILAAELNQITQIDNTMGWRSNGVGHILGATARERELEASQIAAKLNADVVIYGIVRSDGVFNSFEPEFYITAEFAALEPELVGGDALGNPLEFVGNSEDQILAANSFQRRLGVMRYFLRGLAFYLAGNFEGAEDAFEQAIAVESEGLELLYIFAGNAAIRIPNAEAALAHYDNALRQRPSYARALVGRGIAIYRLALETAGQNPAPYDATLSLSSEQTCNNVAIALPAEAQLLGELALRCYQEASSSEDKPETADIDVKVAFGIGQTSLWLSLNNYGDYWEAVERELSLVIELYNASPEERQARIRAAAAHANAWLGLRLLSIDGSNEESVCMALNYYRTSIGLLRLDVNREYNQRWIELYGEQEASLDDWLNTRNFVCFANSPIVTPEGN